MTPRLLTSSILFAATLAVAPRSQTIHHVGATGFANIDDAILAAAPGDIVLVEPGSYMPFTLNKGLTIRGSTTGVTQILNFAGLPPFASIPLGQTAHLTNLDFTGLTISGHATLDQCNFIGGRLSIPNAVVHMQSCVVAGTGTSPFPLLVPLFVDQSDVFASNCTFRGADTPAIGGSAIAVNLSTFRGSNLIIAAGTGSTSLPALTADASSEVVLSDSMISSPSGPCPLLASNGRLARCSLSPACSPLPTLPVLGISRPFDMQLGQSLVLEVQSAPGALVFVWAAHELTPMHVPFLTAPLLLPPATAFPAAILATGSQGQATVAWPIPFNPALLHQALWLQGLEGTALPLRASVAVGGLIH